jgi:hypothetical protein
MSITEWLGVLGLIGALLGFIEYRSKRQDDGRHALRNELMQQFKSFDHDVERVDARLNNHGERITKLERNGNR